MGNNECNMDYKITYSEAIGRLKYMKIKAEVALSTTKCTCSWEKESVKRTIMALDMAINALEKQEKIKDMLDSCTAYPDDMCDCLVQIEKVVKE